MPIYDWYTEKKKREDLLNDPKARGLFYDAGQNFLDRIGGPSAPAPSSLSSARQSTEFDQGLRNKALQDQINAAAGHANQFASSGMAGNVGGGILSGAATGASMGSVVPGWGTLIGGVIGGVAGGIGGALKGKGERETKEEMDRKFNDALLRQIRQQNIENQRADRELNQRGLDWLAQRRDAVMRR
jgi:hypothetical protein